MKAKKAGRPSGTDYKDDARALRMMADAMVRDTKLKPTAAARLVCESGCKPRGASGQAIVDRLVRKWRGAGTTEMEVARMRLAAASVAPMPARGGASRVSQSISGGPPGLEVGRGQSHAVVAAAEFEARRKAWLEEQKPVAVDSRLLDTLRGPRGAITAPYKQIIDEIRSVTGADIVGTTRDEALRLIARTRREILRRYGPNSPRAALLGI